MPGGKRVRQGGGTPPGTCLAQLDGRFQKPSRMCASARARKDYMRDCCGGGEGRSGRLMCHDRARRSWAFPLPGLGTACVALACMPADGPSGLVGTAGSSTGGTGPGLQVNPQDDGAAPSGTGGEGRPASAPACPTDSTDTVTFVSVNVYGRTPPGPHLIRFLERGLGLPPDVEDLPFGVNSPTQLGWLRVVHAPDAAAVVRADAGSNDAGTYDGPTRTIVGPHELGELALSVGEELELTYEFGGTAFNWSRGLVLRRDGRVLLFHLEDIDAGTLDPLEGFGLRRGDRLCATPFPRENPCADIYSTALEVTVPDGATAALRPWQAQTVGEYRVLDGYTTTIERLQGYNGGSTPCADIGSGETLLTALLYVDDPWGSGCSRVKRKACRSTSSTCYCDHSCSSRILRPEAVPHPPCCVCPTAGVRLRGPEGAQRLRATSRFNGRVMRLPFSIRPNSRRVRIHGVKFHAIPR
jgi:hypothetical protein